ncbi:WD40/YVTN/BNR-like repeat-containing protein [Aquabacter spiritensis]|uniref:BNR/Asp-box repeat protein n=1 Tax=Aquabacter spiritensis TaxID=933073 RepID=A0A4R3M497_9HYPH|nr:sialidase family protein [Aquabacter spiritensis]TCT08050.1 BNR/Asp-box repeat protein [Aquabacter spiritensis]
MAQKVLVLIGTKKGTFILESDAQRRAFELRGPYCETWPINHVVGDEKTGTIYAGGGNEWFGPAVWKSEDLGATWSHSSAGLAYGEGETPIKAVWSLNASYGRLLAGVEPAGLFVSADGGASFAPLPGLRDHPSRSDWNPGGAGLILHSLVTAPGDPNKIWVGISAAGVFHSADGGITWEPRNRGTRADFMPEGQTLPEVGQCVHCVVLAPGSGERLYQQNHCGMYRSDDGGRNWHSIEKGLPSSFGFPAAVHPRDPDRLYLIPLNGDSTGRFMPDAKAAVWATADGGATWSDKREGLPQRNAFFNVLRQALATDTLEPAGVYFGTGSGSIYASVDAGETWREAARHLPTISSVETLVVEA